MYYYELGIHPGFWEYNFDIILFFGNINDYYLFLFYDKLSTVSINTVNQAGSVKSFFSTDRFQIISSDGADWSTAVRQAINHSRKMIGVGYRQCQ